MCTVFYRYCEPGPTKGKYKKEHQLGLELLSCGLKKLYDLDVSADGLQGQIEKNEYGKPFLRDYPAIHYNISHCNGLIACGFSKGAVGVDAEKIGAYREAVARKAYTGAERTLLERYREDEKQLAEMFFRLWTLKESRIKQAGMGLSMSLTDFSFDIDKNREPAAVTCSDSRVFFSQFLIRPDYVLSVCREHPADSVNLIQV